MMNIEHYIDCQSQTFQNGSIVEGQEVKVNKKMTKSHFVKFWLQMIGYICNTTMTSFKTKDE